jgi:hypothetical protein
MLTLCFVVHGQTYPGGYDNVTGWSTHAHSPNGCEWVRVQNGFFWALAALVLGSCCLLLPVAWALASARVATQVAPAAAVQCPKCRKRATQVAPLFLDNPTTCGVCLEQCDSRLGVLTCGHVYCVACINKLPPLSPRSPALIAPAGGAATDNDEDRGSDPVGDRQASWVGGIAAIAAGDEESLNNSL